MALTHRAELTFTVPSVRQEVVTRWKLSHAQHLGQQKAVLYNLWARIRPEPQPLLGYPQIIYIIEHFDETTKLVRKK